MTGTAKVAARGARLAGHARPARRARRRTCCASSARGWARRCCARAASRRGTAARATARAGAPQARHEGARQGAAEAGRGPVQGLLRREEEAGPGARVRRRRRRRTRRGSSGPASRRSRGSGRAALQAVPAARAGSPARSNSSIQARSSSAAASVEAGSPSGPGARPVRAHPQRRRHVAGDAPRGRARPRSSPARAPARPRVALVRRAGTRSRRPRATAVETRSLPGASRRPQGVSSSRSSVATSRAARSGGSSAGGRLTASACEGERPRTAPAGVSASKQAVALVVPEGVAEALLVLARPRQVEGAGLPVRELARQLRHRHQRVVPERVQVRALHAAPRRAGRRRPRARRGACPAGAPASRPRARGRASPSGRRCRRCAACTGRRRPRATARAPGCRSAGGRPPRRTTRAPGPRRGTRRSRAGRRARGRSRAGSPGPAPPAASRRPAPRRAAAWRPACGAGRGAPAPRAARARGPTATRSPLVHERLAPARRLGGRAAVRGRRLARGEVRALDRGAPPARRARSRSPCSSAATQPASVCGGGVPSRPSAASVLKRASSAAKTRWNARPGASRPSAWPGTSASSRAAGGLVAGVLEAAHPDARGQERAVVPERQRRRPRGELDAHAPGDALDACRAAARRARRLVEAARHAQRARREVHRGAGDVAVADGHRVVARDARRATSRAPCRRRSSARWASGSSRNSSSRTCARARWRRAGEVEVAGLAAHALVEPEQQRGGPAERARDQQRLRAARARARRAARARAAEAVREQPLGGRGRGSGRTSCPGRMMRAR